MYCVNQRCNCLPDRDIKKEVCNLVFYAQSASMVISGQTNQNKKQNTKEEKKKKTTAF